MVSLTAFKSFFFFDCVMGCDINQDLGEHIFRTYKTHVAVEIMFIVSFIFLCYMSSIKTVHKGAQSRDTYQLKCINNFKSIAGIFLTFIYGRKGNEYFIWLLLYSMLA